jgi:ferrous iron transport protein A
MNKTGVVLAVGAGTPGGRRGGAGRWHLHRRRGRRSVPSEYQELAQLVSKSEGYGLVEVGYDAGGEPSIASAVDTVIKRGAGRVVIVPAAGLSSNLAEVVAVMRERYPEVEITYSRPPVDEAGYAEWIIGKVREHDPRYLGPMRLAALETGERAVIDGFDAGHTLVSRLSALGFTPNTAVTMLQNFGNGPVIVSVRDTRIALGRGEATKIRVRRLGSED